MSRFLCRVSCGLYFRHGVGGRENVPREGGFLMAANHTSFLDPVLLGIRSPRTLHYMARRTLFRPAPVGWFMRRICAVPVDRQNLRRESYREVVELLQAGEGVVIFPEGTRSRDGEVGRFKSGVIRLAEQAGVPIVPAYVDGSHRAWGRGKLFPRPVRTRVLYGELFELPTEGDREENVRLLRDRVLALKEKCTDVREYAPVG